MQSPTQVPTNTIEFSTYLDGFFKKHDMTEDQALSIIIVGKITSFVSLLGCIYVLQDILRDPHKRKESVYHRTMIGVSISDFLVAFGFFLGTWVMPSENIYSYGNAATCNTTGFFIVLGTILSPFYNCSLATYYLLQLKYSSWAQQKMKETEKWLHIVPCLLSSIHPFATIFVENGFGPWGLACR